jgi:hypothetical protein
LLKVQLGAAGAIDTPDLRESFRPSLLSHAAKSAGAPFTTLFHSRSATPKYFLSYSIVAFLYQQVSSIGFRAWLFRNALGIAIAQRAHAMI